jgi:hypothetical protein
MDASIPAGSPVVPFAPGDVVRLRKPHPCGSREWTVSRTGADIGLVCRSCGRRILLERRELERRTVARVGAGDGASEGTPATRETDPRSGADR